MNFPIDIKKIDNLFICQHRSIYLLVLHMINKNRVATLFILITTTGIVKQVHAVIQTLLLFASLLIPLILSISNEQSFGKYYLYFIIPRIAMDIVYRVITSYRLFSLLSVSNKYKKQYVIESDIRCVDWYMSIHCIQILIIVLMLLVTSHAIFIILQIESKDLSVDDFYLSLIVLLLELSQCLIFSTHYIKSKYNLYSGIVVLDVLIFGSAILFPLYYFIFNKTQLYELVAWASTIITCLARCILFNILISCYKKKVQKDNLQDTISKYMITPLIVIIIWWSISIAFWCADGFNEKWFIWNVLTGLMLILSSMQIQNLSKKEENLLKNVDNAIINDMEASSSTMRHYI